jgi:hypothetical protein
MTLKYSMARAQLIAKSMHESRHSTLLLPLLAMFAACAAEPVSAPSATDVATITTTDASGRETRRLVSATLV